MDGVRYFLAWANVPFVTVVAIALLFALLQVTGLLGAIAGGDADADADADVDADADADADGDADGDDSDADHQSAHGIAADLGVGSVPLTVVWQTYAVAFGATGLVVNAIVANIFGVLPAYALVASLPIGLGAGWLVTRTVTRTLARIVSDPRQDVTSRNELVGQTATVASSQVGAEWGEVRVLDKSGHPLRLVCRTRGPKPIASGREVVFVEYDETLDRLYVEPVDEP